MQEECLLFFRSDIGEEVLVDCLKYMDFLLDKVSDHTLLDQLYSKNRELCKVIVLSANKRLSLGYVNRTLKLSVRFLQLGECLCFGLNHNNLNKNWGVGCYYCHSRKFLISFWLSTRFHLASLIKTQELLNRKFKRFHFFQSFYTFYWVLKIFCVRDKLFKFINTVLIPSPLIVVPIK